ncbi:MAG: cytochrome c oxidase subunit II [Planctomycetota bacterium]|nr:cytochrome c oxidase subunit II [Planctomycetota bacterium]
MTPVIFVLVILGLVVGTVAGFALKAPLLPDLITEHGRIIDQQLVLTLYITGAIFAIAQLGLAYLIYKHRHRDGVKASYLQGSTKLEYTWTVATLVLFVGLNLMGQGVWAQMHLNEKPARPVNIEVTAMQFKWIFRYPGKDGNLGARAAEYINPAEGNYVGKDPDDANGDDDFQLLSMSVPYGIPVVVDIRSIDVLHGFAVREMRLKQDAVPGLSVNIPFTVEKDGTLEFPLSGNYAADLDKGELPDALKHELNANKLVWKDKASLRALEPGRVWRLTLDPDSINRPYLVKLENGRLNLYRSWYELACMELCGYGHYQMRSQVNVLSPVEYAEFVEKNSP